MAIQRGTSRQPGHGWRGWRRQPHRWPIPQRDLHRKGKGLAAFLVCALAGLLVILAFLPAPVASQAVVSQGVASPPPRTEIRGVWMTGNDMATLRHRPSMQVAVGELGRLGFNTIYPVVWNGGYAYYPSAVTRRHRIQPFTFKGLEGQDILADLIREAHGRGLLVIPWFEFGFMAPPSSELAQLHPDWLTQKRDGSRTSMSDAGEVVWLNPLRPEVQTFITDLVMEIVTQYEADGIQFDDHMSLPSDFGYDPFTTSLYARETGRSAPVNAQDPAWVRWRADRITAFMAQLNQKIRARKPAAIISVSPNYYGFAYKLQLQDWLAWLRRRLVDEIVVQLYRPDLESFLPQLLSPELLEARRSIPTAVAILSGQRNRPVPMGLIQAQAQATRERGLGVAFFYFETLWNRGAEAPATRQEGFQVLFSSPPKRSVPAGSSS